MITRKIKLKIIEMIWITLSALTAPGFLVVGLAASFFANIVPITNTTIETIAKNANTMGTEIPYSKKDKL